MKLARFPFEDRLRPGEHLCFFYESKQEQFRVVFPFLGSGLAKGEKCLYIADENSAAEIKAGLLVQGVDVDRCLTSGQLSIITAGESYLHLGRFDADDMISLLTLTMSEALREGYPGVRGAAEMTWILRGSGSPDDLWKFEAGLNAACKGLPFKCLCQYNSRRFLGDIVMKVLRTHPRVLLGLDLYENPFYEP